MENGFTSIIINGEERPQSVICCKTQTNDSVKPAKTKQHLLNFHPQHKEKNKNFFELHGDALKKMKLASTEHSIERNKEAIEASYVITLEIAKQKKTYNLGKSYQKSDLSKWWKLFLEIK